jgi:hypothetical protein
MSMSSILNTRSAILGLGLGALLFLTASPAAGQSNSDYGRDDDSWFWGSSRSSSFGRQFDRNSDIQWFHDLLDSNRSRRGQFDDLDDQRSRSSQQEIRGEVLRTKRVEPRGIDTDVLIALIETDNGREAVVDLGPVDDLRDNDLRLHRGDRLTARGRFVSIGDQRLFVARSLRCNGQTVAIDRPFSTSLGQSFGRDTYTRHSNYQSYYQGPGRRDRDDRDFGSQDDEERGPRTMQHRGKVVGTRAVEIPGIDERMLLVLVKNDQGRKVVVCLGAAADVEQAGLDKGQNISCRGLAFQFGGRCFLLAQQVRADGQTVNIRQQHPDEMQPIAQRFRGEIVRTKQVELPGMKEPWLIALVRTTQGRQSIVNLGPISELEELQLQKGDEVAIRGQVLRINGQRIVLADQVRAKGETVQINE